MFLVFCFWFVRVCRCPLGFVFCLGSFCGLGFVASRRMTLCCKVFCALFFVSVVAGLGLVLGVAVVLFCVFILYCLFGLLDLCAPFVFGVL